MSDDVKTYNSVDDLVDAITRAAEALTNVDPTGNPDSEDFASALTEFTETMTATVDRLYTAISDIATDDAYTLLVVFTDVAKQIGALNRSLQVTLADKLPGDSGTFTNTLTGRLEPVHVTRSGTVHTDSRGALNALTHTYVDPDTGESTPAIPVSVLLDILPGVNGTSGKLLKGGLEKYGVTPSDFITTKYGKGRLAFGADPRPNRKPKD